MQLTRTAASCSRGGGQKQEGLTEAPIRETWREVIYGPLCQAKGREAGFIRYFDLQF